MFTGCTPDELEDPHNPPRGRGRPIHDRWAKQVIICIQILCFRLLVCQEIVRNEEHPKLELFQDFQMTVYCFPEPDTPAQVLCILYLLFCRITSFSSSVPSRIKFPKLTSRWRSGRSSLWAGSYSIMHTNISIDVWSRISNPWESEEWVWKSKPLRF